MRNKLKIPNLKTQQ